MHTRSDNEEIMTGSDTDEVIEELFELFLQKYDFNKITLNIYIMILTK